MTERKDSQMSLQDRERDRDRSRRQSRFSDANFKADANDRDRSRERRSVSNRIYVSNILDNALCPKSRPRQSSSHDKDYNGSYNTYGLSTSFLEGLGIFGPLHTKVFVTNLDDKVDAKKLEQVFNLAGRVVSVDLSTDKDGNSRGFAVVEYDHPVEAVQAISMLDHQMLYDRKMAVRMDRIPDKNEAIKLPEGLEGLGIGLGFNGEPLRDVARNFPSLQQEQNQLQQNNPSVPVTPPSSLNGPSYRFLCLVIISAVSTRMLSYLIDLSKFAATL